MLIDIHKLSGIYLICGKTDLRRGIEGLAGVIQEEYHLDPYSRALFLFCGTRKDRFKALYWAGDGFILLYKRIEDGRLQWPTTQNEVKKLHAKQLERLLSGWGLESTVNQFCPRNNGRKPVAPVVHSTQHQ
ncbi:MULTISPECIES: IS66 family insertion sequence element accessory protein TnpB [Lacticaseibacillus]|uniref:IS66 family insertion sequence element accessory protein TnpB n=1 Tax=Lacticaseibacillus TaxID=2759736 RepID=UPI0015C9E06F|nr:MULTISPECIES: IS66 family insertion sequence element accessory protein TnpB [Lacticaseibacillus]